MEDRRKEEKLTTPITLLPLDEPTLTELCQRYDDASDAETRIRYQTLLLSARGQTSTQIAAIVLCSQDTSCVCSSAFSQEGSRRFRDAPPQAEIERSLKPGRARGSRVIELDPHEVGQDTANWTTQLLATYQALANGDQRLTETVRVYLHAHDYGGLATDLDGCQRKAEEKADYVGNACG